MMFFVTTEKGLRKMKVTKDKGTTIVEISGEELSMYKVTFRDMNCKDVHTRAVIRDILSTALSEEKSLREQKEILLLPDCRDGCVIVCKEREVKVAESVFSSFSCSVFCAEESKIFCSFFS